MDIIGTAKEYLSQKRMHFIVLGATLAAAILLSFCAASMSDFILYHVGDYEEGQISERDVRSSISATIPAENGLKELRIRRGEMVLRKNFPVSQDALRKFNFLAEHGNSFDMRPFVGSIVFLALLFFFAAFLFSQDVVQRKMTLKEEIFVAVNFCLVFAFAAFIPKISAFSSDFTMNLLSIAPLCSMLTAILISPRIAAAFSIVSALGVLTATRFSLIPFLTTLFTCTFAVRLVQNVKRRMNLFFTAVYLAVVQFLVTFALLLCFPQGLLPSVGTAFASAGNAFLCGLLVLGFLPPLESFLNTATVFRLLDLSDVNTPILKKMLLVAPGTYNHSLNVAAMAELACDGIGANSLLARVGAYYHDLGKIDNPEYFTENQEGENKHDELTPTMSVSVIRSHVRKGVEKARELHLPDDVVSIIEEHHGNGVIAWFYNKAKKENPDVNESDYSYFGTPPSSREAAVVMLADTAEAACKSLDKPSVKAITDFIDTLVEAKLKNGQLDNSKLSFKELDVIKSAFVTHLSSQNHSRIKYPGQKDFGEKEKSEKKNAN